VLAAVLGGTRTLAQCDNTANYGSYGSTSTGAPGTSSTVTCQYAGEYHPLSGVVSGYAYRTTSTIATDYITVRSGSSSGPVVASGVQPLYWQANSAGTYYVHTNLSAACGIATVCRNVTDLFIGPACTNSSAWGSGVAPAGGSNVNLSPTCSYAGEYGTVTGGVAGQEYTANTTGGSPTDYLSIHMGTYNGPVIAAGTQPVTFTLPSAGNFYVHINTNSSCGTASVCHTINIAATAPPGCVNGSFYDQFNAPAIGSSHTTYCNFGGEYNQMDAAVAGTGYTVSSSNATDYITVHQGTTNGPVVAIGVQPVSFTAGVAGTYFIDVNPSSACGSEIACRDVTVLATLTCNYPSNWNTWAMPTVGNIVTHTCEVDGYYSTYTGGVAGVVYQITDNAGLYYTVRMGTPGGPVIASGQSGLYFTAPVSGNYYLHLSTSTACPASAFICRTVSIEAFPCVVPQFTVASTNENCISSTFDVTANLTDLAGATAVDISVSVNGGPYSLVWDDVSSIQAYAMGTFTIGQSIAVSVTKSADPACTSSKTTTDSGLCPTLVTCGGPAVSETYCYPNSMTLVNNYWKYQSAGGSVLRFTAVQLNIESATFDHINIYDGTSNAGTLLFSHSGPTNNYAGMQLLATSGNLYIEASSDGSWSCGDALIPGPWQWNVECLNCTPPAATVTNVANCATNEYAVQVDVTSLGDAPNVDLISSVSGTFADDVGLGTYNAPLVAYGTPQTITVQHNGLAVCNISFNVNPVNQCVTNATCGYSLAVPDGGCGANNVTEAVITISGVNTQLGTDVNLKNVDIILTHTWNSDMQIELESPNGAIVSLVNGRGGSGDNMGNPADCPNTVLRLQDGGPVMPTAATNLSGTYAAEQPLTGFNDGSDPNGNWILRMCDAVGSDVGFLNYVDLNLVNCGPPVAEPQMVVPNCVDNNMMVQVEITSLGTSTSVDISSNVNGVETTVTTPGVYMVGPYSFPAAVQLTLLADNPDCDVTLPALNYAACPPPNDNCGDVPPSVLGWGDSYVGGGTLAGSTVDFPFWSADVTGDVWHPFTLTEACNLVIVKMCGTTPAPYYTSLVASTACPTTSFAELVFGSYSFDYCFDGSPSVVFENMPAGTYYFPALVSTNDVGLTNYSMEISVNPCPTNVDCATANAVSCGDVFFSSTNGLPNNLPELGEACLYCSVGSTGGVNWWSFNEPITQEVTVSTCDIAFFDTRISVYQVVDGMGCDSLRCVAANDDGLGCANFSSETHFTAVANEQYYIVIHGWGAGSGAYTMAVTCASACTVPANDLCPDAETLTPVLMDGTGVPTLGSNACAHSDVNPACDQYGGQQGVWYVFNTTDRSEQLRLTLLSNNEDPSYTATDISFALYAGCPTTCPVTTLTCATSAGGTNVLPPLADNTDYWLNVWNDGGLGIEGSFGILLEYPPDYDASIDSITYPYNPVCGTLLNPTVILTNNGLVTLTDVDIQYDVDGSGTQTFSWSGSLPYLASESVDLPSIVSPGGSGHTFNATTTGPLNITFADEIPSNNDHTNNYDVSGEAVVLNIRTDANPSQITWRIYENGLGNLVAEGGTTVSPGPGVIWDPGVYPASSTHTVELCLPTTYGSCYSLFVYDSGNNGITNGTWQLETTNGEVLLRDNGSYTNQSPSTAPLSPATYSNGHEFCLPKGAADIKSDECEIYTNLPVDKVYCKAVPGSLRYQFRFSDPNAGFVRFIAVTTNWVRFNQMVSNPLVPGTIYFAAAKPDLGSLGDFSDDRFGSGCEMALDPNVTYCTQLNPLPGPTFSCGVTTSFGGSSKIWATPVPTATQYHFKFVNVGEGYQKTVTRTNYVCPLNWVTTPLVNGSTYDVTVEAYVGSSWQGYCGNTCTVTINNSLMGGQGNQNVAVVEQDGVKLWPNPVRDGNVSLLIEGLSDATQNITVDIFDAQGKLMLSKEYGNSGEVFNTVLELGSHIAAGTYQVNITVNGKTTTQRLSVQ